MTSHVAACGAQAAADVRSAERVELSTRLYNVWLTTHPDYRSRAGGVRQILVVRFDAFQWVPLGELNEFEILSRLELIERHSEVA